MVAGEGEQSECSPAGRHKVNPWDRVLGLGHYCETVSVDERDRRQNCAIDDRAVGNGNRVVRRRIGVDLAADRDRRGVVGRAPNGSEHSSQTTRDDRGLTQPASAVRS
jgi:hypothetical protein